MLTLFFIFALMPVLVFPIQAPHTSQRSCINSQSGFST